MLKQTRTAFAFNAVVSGVDVMHAIHALLIVKPNENLFRQLQACAFVMSPSSDLAPCPAAFDDENGRN